MTKIEPGSMVVIDGKTREVIRVDEEIIIVRLDGESTGAYPCTVVSPVEEE